MSDEITFPLGTRVPRRYHRADVIGEVLRTTSGNTAIRVGERTVEGWEQRLVVTLSPKERELLIQELQRHQQDEDRNEDGELEERASYGDH